MNSGGGFFICYFNHGENKKCPLKSKSFFTFKIKSHCFTFEKAEIPQRYINFKASLSAYYGV